MSTIDTFRFDRKTGMIFLFISQNLVIMATFRC
jgi:hypothetical protein